MRQQFPSGITGVNLHILAVWFANATWAHPEKPAIIANE